MQTKTCLPLLYTHKPNGNLCSIPTSLTETSAGFLYVLAGCHEKGGSFRIYLALRIPHVLIARGLFFPSLFRFLIPAGTYTVDSLPKLVRKTDGPIHSAPEPLPLQKGMHSGVCACHCMHGHVLELHKPLPRSSGAGGFEKQ